MPVVLRLKVFTDVELNNLPDVYDVLFIWWYYSWTSFSIHGILISQINLDRRSIMRKSLPDLIQILEKNVRDLQEQLRNAHKRIKVLSNENYDLRRKGNIESDFGYDLTKGDGWAEEPVENPDAQHIKKANDFKTGG